MAFCDELIALRRGRGLSQEALGEAVGVSRQTVSKWECGQTTPELDKLLALADFFGLTLDELVGRATEGASDGEAVSAGPDDCGRPAGRFRWRGYWSYEYVSRRRFRGIPLVHIHLGYGFCRARGIVAIGNLAAGVISVGGLSVGVISLGGVSVGAAALGGVAIGLAAGGGVAVGLLALGGLAVGVRALGGLAVGRYAAGGLAIGAGR